MGKKHNKILTTIIIVIAILTLLSALVLSYLIFFNPNNIKLDKNKLLLSRNNVVVKDCVGDNISNDLMFNTIEMSNLNDYTKQAFIVSEDKRFYSHNGIDTTRMVGAMLANLKSNSIAQGGSTITQQLIKNTHLTNAKTMRRKFNEIGLSLQIERQYNKNDILSMYLNTIYFGEGAYGINNAAKTYFNKTADNLSIEESATLVAIIKAPTYYNPTVNIAKCKERRNIVLKLMRDSDVINQQQYEDAIDKDIVVKISERTKDNSSYVNSAIIEASKALGMSQLEILNQKYIISTYLDSDTQKKLIEAIDSNKTLTTSNKNATICGIVGNNIDSSVVAYLGNNDVFNMRRQVGSTLKPLSVYMPALNEGIIHACSIVDDNPTSFGNYSPSNYANKYLGSSSIRRCIETSSNVVAVKTLNALTLDKSLRYLNQNGIDVNSNDKNLTLALGNTNAGINPLELTQGYMTLANDGVFNRLSFIKSIANVNGDILYSHNKDTHTVCDDSAAYITTDMLKGVVNNGTAQNLKLPQLDIAGKTGTVGLKNGDNSDAIFTSYNNDCTSTIWIYTNNDDSLTQQTTGGSAPIKIARQLYSKLYDNKSLPIKKTMPQTIVNLNIDRKSLKDGKVELANIYTPYEETQSELFIAKYQPLSISNNHSKPPYQLLNGNLVGNILTLTFTKNKNTNYQITVYENGAANNYSINETPTLQIELKSNIKYDIWLTPINAQNGIIGESSNILTYYVTNSNESNPSKSDKNSFLDELQKIIDNIWGVK